MKFVKSLPYLSLLGPIASAYANPLNYSMDATSTAQVVDSTQVESRVIGLYLGLKSFYLLSPSLKFKLNAGALLETGTDRSLWVSEFSPDQQVVLEEASFNWNPKEYFELNVGALDQGFYDLPTLVSSTPFVGARETLKLGFGEGRSINLSSQQALPSNQTLANRLGNVESGTPKYFIHRLELALDGDLLALKAYGGLFEYQDLSEGVAQQSRFLGNSVTGISANNAKFSYNFRGQFFGGELKWFATENMNFAFKGHLLENKEAPELRSKARFAEASFTYQKLSLGLASFRLESDATVAFYNSKVFAHNNREGFLAKMDYEADFAKISLLYSKSETITDGPYQGAQTYLSAALSKTLF